MKVNPANNFPGTSIKAANLPKIRGQTPRVIQVRNLEVLPELVPLREGMDILEAAHRLGAFENLPPKFWYILPTSSGLGKAFETTRRLKSLGITSFGINKYKLISSLEKNIPSWIKLREDESVNVDTVCLAVYGRLGEEKAVFKNLEAAYLIERAVSLYPVNPKFQGQFLAGYAKVLNGNNQARADKKNQDFIYHASQEIYKRDNSTDIDNRLTLSVSAAQELFPADIPRQGYFTGKIFKLPLEVACATEILGSKFSQEPIESYLIRYLESQTFKHYQGKNENHRSFLIGFVCGFFANKTKALKILETKLFFKSKEEESDFQKLAINLAGRLK